MIVNNTIINNGVDTSDATATAENIDFGYTAYVNGEKIEGSSLKVNTSSDTVTEDVLLEGYTAHDCYGTPIVGRYTPHSLLNASVNLGSATNVTIHNIEKYAFDERNMTILVHFMDGDYNDINIYIDIEI